MAGQAFLITGASGGMGGALARRLVARGDSVVLLSRNSAAIDALADSLGPAAIALDGDAGREDYLGRAVSLGLETHGRIDGLAHCVGSIHLKPLHTTTPDEFTRAIHVNVTTAFLACRAILPELRKARSGSIVLISTVAAQQGLNHHEVIAAAKGALEAMVRSAAITHARWNVRFNCVAPGMTETPLTVPLLQSEPNRKFSEAIHPLGRLGRPEDIAAAIAFLLGEDSSWITGQVLGVDGGLGAGVAPPRVTVG